MGHLITLLSSCPVWGRRRPASETRDLKIPCFSNKMDGVYLA